MAQEFIINGNRFECVFKLTSADGETSVDFTKSAIKSLDLVENIFEPFQHATITFSNPFDFIESEMLTRGDGSDLFEFSIKPTGDLVQAAGEVGDTDPTLKYKFVIGDELNSTSKESRNNNLKTYTLIDQNYWKLNQPIPYGTRYRGKIGDILKEIFKEKEIQINEEKWEAGDHFIDIFPEHLLPPTSFRYADLVKYLIRYNYNNVSSGGQQSSAQGDPSEGDTYVRSMLIWDRSDKDGDDADRDGAYHFQPLNKLYENIESMEAFIIGDMADEYAINANNPGEMKEREGKTFAYKSEAHNTDLTTPMLTYSNEYFINFIASGYDPELGQHGLREIRIEEVKEKWKAMFVDPFKTLDGEPDPFLPLNEEKKQRLFKTFSFPFSLNKVAKIAEAEMISNLTFYNLEMAMTQIGDTKRTAGKFVDVMGMANAVDVDAKLIGTWLVTRCHHQFSHDNYFNTLQCIKTYVGPGSQYSNSIDNVKNDCPQLLN
mgnify:FL=1